MDAAERRERHRKQTEQIYAGIGRFAVKFEHVCHAMHSCVMNLLQHNGLKNQQLANAVLEGLTAEPLRRMLAAAIAETKRDQLIGEEKQILDNIIRRIVDLTEARNDVLHRTWFVGWAALADDDFSTTAGWKFKNTKKGVEFRPLEYTSANFESLATEADRLTEIIRCLEYCLLYARPFASNLAVESDGIVRRCHDKPPAQKGRP
jgi:hypothetical protein